MPKAHKGAHDLRTATAPACAKQLRLEVPPPRAAAAAGPYTLALRFVNKGASACTLTLMSCSLGDNWQIMASDDQSGMVTLVLPAGCDKNYAAAVDIPAHGMTEKTLPLRLTPKSGQTQVRFNLLFRNAAASTTSPQAVPAGYRLKSEDINLPMSPTTKP